MKNENIEWVNFVNDSRSIREISKELKINEKTFRRNFKRLNLKKIKTSRVGKYNWPKKFTKEEIKSRDRERKKKYYKINKKFFNKKSKEYYYKNKKILNKLSRIYRHKNKKRLNEISKKYYKKNKEQLKINEKEYYKKNREKILKKVKKYNNENKDKKRIYIKKRIKNDINYKLKITLSTRIRKALKRTNCVKSHSTTKLIGCSVDFLKQHLEKQFQEGMTWKNHGKWQIDHIKPCASFNLTKDTEQKKCFHYSNLQPLWAIENIRKGNKIER